MSEWVLQKAAEFCASVRDGTHDSPKSVEGGGKPLVTSKVVKQGVVRVEDAYLISEKDYRKINERSKVDRWDILMTMIGTVGECAIVKDDPDYAIKNIALFKMSGDEEKAKWLYYYLTSPMGQGALRGNFRGSSQQYISLDQLRNLEIPVPEKNVRSQIVAILSDYDSAIDNARRQIALLEEAAMRLYREWFGDGKREKCLLRDYIYFQEGPGIRNWQYVESKGVRFINIRCIKNGDVDISNASMISSDEAFGKYRHFQLQEDDIVMSCSGTLGRSAVIRKDHLPLCLNTSVIRFRPKLDNRDYSYIYCYLNSDDFLDSQKAMANGAAQLNFGPKHLNLIQMDLPSQDARYVFNEHVLPMLAAKKRLYCQIRKLTEVRDRLLPKLISGEIEV